MRKISLFLSILMILTMLLSVGVYADETSSNYAVPFEINEDGAYYMVEQKTGTRPTKLGVVSSEYHLFRASLFAREHGVEFVGIPAETTRISLKINYFLREVAGVWHYILLGGRYE